MMNYHNMLNIKVISRLQMVLIAALVAVSSTAFGQFNVKVGYSLGFVSPEINNAILADYNAVQSTFYDDYKPAADIKLTYGISLGARYKFGIGSIELNWENLSRSTTSIGFVNPVPPATASSASEEFRYKLNMLMLTYESSSLKAIGVGSSIGRNRISIERDAGNEPAPQFGEGDNRNQYFARFHLAFNFYGSSTVAFAIKPYVQLPLTDIDLLPFATRIGATNDRYDESFPMFGLTFAFYNGRQ